MTRRRGGPPRRKITAAARRRELLVFTEGRVTEVQYLNQWHRVYRDRTRVHIGRPHDVPLPLVRHAVRAKQAAIREARRGGGPAYDEYWCVYDHDDHPHLDQAQQLADAHGIRVAISNPCIELWFLLHFTDQTAYIERDAAKARSKALLGCGKHLDEHALGALDEGYEAARRRAQALDERHAGNRSAPGRTQAAVSGICWRRSGAVADDLLPRRAATDAAIRAPAKLSA